MAPKYKLIYFNLRGLGEPIRFLFHYGGIPFEEKRIEFGDWPKVKHSYPFPQLPILEIDGKPFPQGASIARYVAKQVGLTGKDDLEALEIDSVVDTIIDLRIALAGFYFESDEALKKKKKDIAVKETVPSMLSKFDARVKENGGYFVGGKLTWADVYFGAVHATFNHFVGENVIAKYPNLKALVDKVQAIPAIKAWVEKRPVTEF
ncbi:glutathione S-transferase-like [Anabrus simplex]|uniref:glutathione S-transferase-like n=1 Tax=Anabrus simplex TaxID=316456 RepID=UPI0035A2DD56